MQNTGVVIVNGTYYATLKNKILFCKRKPLPLVQAYKRVPWRLGGASFYLCPVKDL
jgi:hypothetical protein